MDGSDLLLQPPVDDRVYVLNGEACLGDVGGDDDLGVGVGAEDLVLFR